MPKSPHAISNHVRVSGLGCGAVFLILMIALAALNTGTNLLYLMLSGLLAFWTFSILAGWANLRGLEITRRLPAEAHARTPTHIEYEIKNHRRRLGAFGLSLRDELADSGRPPVRCHFLGVSSGSKSVKEVEFRPHRRGVIRFARIRLLSSFPFGFLDLSRVFTLEAELLVFPELIPVTPVIRARAVELGMRDSRVRGPGSNLYAIRDYAPGDPARSIHWKLSAKGMGVKIRETEREESLRVRIILDFPIRRNAGADEMERFERSVSAAASLADLYLKRGVELTLWTPKGTVPLGSGPQQWSKIQTSLALVDAADWLIDGDMPHPPRAGEFMDIAVTPETLDEICMKTGDEVVLAEKKAVP